MANEKYSIALWGPTASGKTWFIHSFAKKLLLDYTDDPSFVYEIKNARTGSAIPSTPPIDRIDGTQELEDKLWLFRRGSRAQTSAHVVSSYEHLISVRDDMGKRLFEIDDDEHEMTRLNVVESDYILIMLDPINLQRKKDASQSEAPKASLPSSVTSAKELAVEGGTQEQKIDTKPANVEVENRNNKFPTPGQYTERLEKLLQILVQEGRDKSKSYCIAVCVTKIDRLKIYERDPWEIIQLYFGRGMYELLRRYSNMPQLKIETFSVSAFGFVGMNMESNYKVDSEGNGGLKDDTRWKPYNVEAPLFWLFEEVERKKLQSENSGFLVRTLFSGERKNNYIGYKIKRT